VAQLALDLEHKAEFDRVVPALVQHHPEVMQSHLFNAIRLANDEKWQAAEVEIKEAERLGLAPAVVQSFLDSGVHSKVVVWRYAYYSGYLVAAWALGLGLLFLAGKNVSRLTLRSIEVDDPNDQQNTRHATLRSIYRGLINTAGAYYYVSIPFVIFLVLAIAGSVTYGCFMAGRVPIQLVVMLVAGALLTSYKMIHSLFVRHKREDPGRALRRAEAPGLWDLAANVAKRINTTPITEIRVTPGTDLGVYERDTQKGNIGRHQHRVLILGVGVLNGFTQEGFRAVLAHEYGHFAHRDTAGGDVALKINDNIINFYHGMLATRQAVWWNMAFQFLRLYQLIFRRITHGATRLQEVLADRVAVLTYGAAAFEEGLRHVIRRAAEFEDIAYWEIQEANKVRRPLRNLYQLEPVVGKASVADKVRKQVNRATTEDDTHPSAADRFRYAQRIRWSPAVPAAGMVWDLFVNPDGLTEEMSKVISTRLQS